MVIEPGVECPYCDGRGHYKMGGLEGNQTCIGCDGNGRITDRDDLSEMVASIEVKLQRPDRIWTGEREKERYERFVPRAKAALAQPG